MNFASIVASGAVVLGLTSMAQAEGLTFRLEGGLGIVRADNVGIFSLGRVPAETETSQLDYGGGMAPGADLAQLSDRGHLGLRPWQRNRGPDWWRGLWS